MARGGKREGAGRKRGVPNKVTLKQTAAIAKTGATPLEVMLTEMRFHYDLADKALKASEPDIESITSHLRKASAVAKDASPYSHPALKAIEHSGPGGGAIEHRITDARSEVERKMAGLAALGETPGVPR